MRRTVKRFALARSSTVRWLATTRRPQTGTRCAGLTAAFAASTLAVIMVAAPAHADAGATVKAQTQRMSDANLGSGQDGWYNEGDHLTLVCSKRGQPVKGFFSFNIPGG